jgi:ATP-dependent protease ClpP protease subunit
MRRSVKTASFAVICIILAVAGVALDAMLARAASFSSIVDKYGNTWIGISGDIELNDHLRYDYFLNTLPPNTGFVGFTLNSAGGNLIEARIFAQIARRPPNFATYVADHRECSSACFLIWAAAEYRLASPTASIGVHSISSIYGKETLATKAYTTDQARELAMDRVSPTVIGKLTSTPPGSIAWLTAKDLESMDIQIVASNGASIPPMCGPKHVCE